MRRPRLGPCNSRNGGVTGAHLPGCTSDRPCARSRRIASRDAVNPSLGAPAAASMPRTALDATRRTRTPGRRVGVHIAARHNTWRRRISTTNSARGESHATSLRGAGRIRESAARGRPRQGCRGRGKSGHSEFPRNAVAAPTPVSRNFGVSPFPRVPERRLPKPAGAAPGLRPPTPREHANVKPRRAPPPRASRHGRDLPGCTRRRPSRARGRAPARPRCGTPPRRRARALRR